MQLHCITVIINPRCIGIVVLCVCVSVYYQANCYIPGLYVENKVPLGFLWNFQHNNIHCVDSFKTLCSIVMVTFADHHCLLRFLMSSHFKTTIVNNSFSPVTLYKFTLQSNSSQPSF